MQDESLDQRGSYEGEIACYTIGLRARSKRKNPEGWGQLYHYTGRATTSTVASSLMPDDYLKEAINAYEAALTTLTAFPYSHLSLLQDAIRAHLGLNQPAKASEYREQGLKVFHQLLNADSTSTQKQRLEQKFSGFSQIQVDTSSATTTPPKP